MLNKLLKRCMPWMDKGRWYHVEYEFDSNNQLTYIKYDNIFNSHEIDSRDNQLKLHVSNDHPKIVVKDYKMMNTPPVDRFIVMESDMYIHTAFGYDDNNGDITDIYLMFPNVRGRVEYWIYVTEG